MNARALPHRPTSKRPARRRLTLSPVDCVRVTRLSPSFSWAIPRVAVRSPSTKRFCSGVGGGGGASADSARAESGGGGLGGGVGCCAPATVAATQHSTAKQRIRAPLYLGSKPGVSCHNDASRNLAPGPHLRRPGGRARALPPARRRSAAPPRV